MSKESVQKLDPREEVDYKDQDQIKAYTHSHSESVPLIKHDESNVKKEIGTKDGDVINDSEEHEKSSSVCNIITLSSENVDSRVVKTKVKSNDSEKDGDVNNE